MKSVNLYIDGTYYLRLWKFMTYDHLPFQYVINWSEFKVYLLKEISKNFNTSIENLMIKKSSIFFNEVELSNLNDSFMSQFSSNSIDAFIQRDDFNDLNINQFDFSWQACKNYYKDPYDFIIILTGQTSFIPLLNGLKREGVKCIVAFLDDITPVDSPILKKADLTINFEYLFNKTDDEAIKSIFQRKILNESESEELESNKEVLSKKLIYSSFSANNEIIQTSRKQRLDAFMDLKEVVLNTRKISDYRKIELERFCSNINLKNIDYELIDIAFLHKSYANESSAVSKNLELAYIGHDIIDTVISVYLYRMNSKKIIEPHVMAVKQRTYKMEENVTIAAKEIHMDKYLLLGKGEDSSGGRDKPTILSGAFASLVGIIFLARGYEAAEDFIVKHLLNKLDEKRLTGNTDYKTQLQELTQKLYKVAPVYSLDRIEGPQHEQKFWMCVSIKNKRFGPISGNNKREASQNAAKIAFEYLKHHNI